MRTTLLLSTIGLSLALASTAFADDKRNRTDRAERAAHSRSHDERAEHANRTNRGKHHDETAEKHDRPEGHHSRRDAKTGERARKRM
jgi:hypothetical protein